MKIFPITFTVGCLELDAIVTASENNDRFKVEMVTGEPHPIILNRCPEGNWSIENFGTRSMSAQAFLDIEQAIEKHLNLSAD
ncbi:MULTISPECIES: hypothetical protein [Pedobacter]|uniref:hypothetical protein n=1 Tax=Pedobacter TaxID=84567 RepID=UPI00210CA358|nr:MULTISPECIES: hypothetical protein [unclassified Pedobacter]